MKCLIAIHTWLVTVRLYEIEVDDLDTMCLGFLERVIRKIQVRSCRRIT